MEYILIVCYVNIALSASANIIMAMIFLIYTLGSPSCAACLGGPADTFARLNKPEVCVSTTNRNFPGRMGDKKA